MKESGNNMDDKSREAAQNIHILFDDGAWHKMEKLLNEADKQPAAPAISNTVSTGKKPGKRSRSIAIFLLFLFIVTSLLLTKNNTVLKTGIGPVVNRDSKAPVRNARKSNPENSAISKLAVKELVSSYLLKEEFEKYNFNNKYFKPETTIDKKISLPLLKTIRYDKDELSEDFNKRQETKINYLSHGNKIDRHKKVVINLQNGSGELNADDQEITAMYLAIKDKILTGKVKDSIDQKIKITVGINKKDTVNTRAVHKNNKLAASKNKFFKHIGFSVFASPEVNTVQFKRSEKLTVNYGAGINYTMGKHFTLQAMLINTRKVYATDRKGYSPIAGSSFVYVDSLKVNADCKIWDIPLNLRYSFTGNSNNSFFISAGLSSYIMKKEIYNFTYYEQGEYKTKQRIIENENKHSFCNLNFSAGYQYWLNKKWSIRFEPYLKLPLNGIGVGRVKLTSAGALFSLTFKPL